MIDSPPDSEPPLKPDRASRMRTWAGGILGTSVVAVILWIVFAPAPLMLEFTTVTQGPMQVTINNQGQVRAHDKYTVASPVAAELKRIALREGDQVHRNQVVATLRPLPLDPRQKEEASARLEAARALAREAALLAQRAYADLQFAINDHIRIQSLAREAFVSPQAVERAATTERTSRANWIAARSREQATLADVKAAEAALIGLSASRAGGTVQLTSPVDGYVLNVPEKSARTVAAGTPLLTIGDPTRYEIVVDVLSTDAVKISPGNLMLLEEWGGAQTLRAKVRLIEPTAFTKISALGVEEQRVNIVADPVDSLGSLGDGYRIEARIVIWSEERVTKVAASSLFRVGGAWHIFVVENGRAREREVKVGRRNQDEAQVLSGLQAGETVIRYPNNQIADGTRVVPSARS
jgi:HlyD family secretion protein